MHQLSSLLALPPAASSCHNRLENSAPTFQLLRAIAESPAPGTVSQTSGSATKIKRKAVKAHDAAEKAERGIGSWLGQRKTTRPAKIDRERAIDAGKNAKNAPATMRKEGATSSMPSPAGMGRQNHRETFASPAVSRKRPRSSPESGSTASGSRSGNPFKAFEHRFRPPPPSPSSRLGIDGGSPKPLPQSRAYSGASTDEKLVGGIPAASVVRSNAEDFPQAGVASCHPAAAGDSRGVGVDLSQSAGEDSDDFALTSTPTRRRGTAVRAATSAASTSHKGGDGSVSSPVSLVDLSQSAEEKTSLRSTSRLAGAATPVRDDAMNKPEEGCTGNFSLTHPGETDSRPCQEAPNGGAAASGTGNDEDCWRSPLLSSGCPGEVEHGDLGNAEQDGSDEGGAVGVECDGGRHGEKEEENERLLASKLYFLVSANTGRVHVYKKEADRREEGLDDTFDEEDGKPQHCRLVALLCLCRNAKIYHT